MTEYEKSLYDVHANNWDSLFITMLRTDDHFLEKKIHRFLYAYYYTIEQKHIMFHYHCLLSYIHHALRKTILTYDTCQSNQSE
ncbi:MULTISPECIES: YhdB family protein [unclassified Pseudogracilibacillus]|uniref:YhdB family protein n=1 Tax=Candidatus Pseudogracilibacillus intestinigallinarum TaxID=2838742 RepID=A0A9D1TKN3_9BACI|nr:YhdB family protein [Candidatus Pseudogracilibacillus intestinigallinarum]